MRGEGYVVVQSQMKGHNKEDMRECRKEGNGFVEI